MKAFYDKDARVMIVRCVHAECVLLCLRGSLLQRATDAISDSYKSGESNLLALHRYPIVIMPDGPGRDDYLIKIKAPFWHYFGLGCPSSPADEEFRALISSLGIEAEAMAESPVLGSQGGRALGPSPSINGYK